MTDENNTYKCKYSTSPPPSLSLSANQGTRHPPTLPPLCGGFENALIEICCWRYASILFLANIHVLKQIRIITILLK